LLAGTLIKKTDWISIENEETYRDNCFGLKGTGTDSLLKTYVDKLFEDSLYQNRCFVNLKSII